MFLINYIFIINILQLDCYFCINTSILLVLSND